MAFKFPAFFDKYVHLRDIHKHSIRIKNLQSDWINGNLKVKADKLSLCLRLVNEMRVKITV
jgi:hypothetical protein